MRVEGMLGRGAIGYGPWEGDGTIDFSLFIQSVSL